MSLQSSCGPPFHLRYFGSRDFVLTLGAPASDQDYDDGGDKVEDCQPPDVPDQRKTHDGRKESGNETGWAVVRLFDCFVGGFPRGTPHALHLPERVDGLDFGQYRIIVGRWRRRG